MVKEKRSEFVQSRVTPSEKNRIADYAKQSEMDLPDYFRKLLLLGVVFKTEAVSVVKVGDAEVRNPNDVPAEIVDEPTADSATTHKQRKKASG